MTPLSRSWRTRFHMSRRSSTSTPAVGSSRNRISGSWQSALAIITRRFMPPDSSMILALRLSQSDSSLSTFSTWAGLGAQPNRPRLKVTVAITLSKASVCSSCGTRPILRRGGAIVAPVSWPSTVTVPALGVTMPQTIEIIVVLPAPFGPSRAKISPLLMSRSSGFSASHAGGVGLAQPLDRDDGRCSFAAATAELRPARSSARGRAASASARWRARRGRSPG